MSLVLEIAKKLGVKPEVLERDAIRLRLRRRLRLIEAEVLSILSRYNVNNIEELETK